MKEELKEQAIALRKDGHSLREISLKLKVAKSTVSLWVKNLVLDKNANHRLADITAIARLKAIKSNKSKRDAVILGISNQVAKDIICVNRNATLDKIFCSLLFWGEGSKSGSDLRITNSDPELIAVFLKLLRSSFQIDESKFRAVLHLHEYHDIEKQKKYWSKITDLPSESLMIYLKSHTGKNKKNNYPGCLSLRYYDYKVALELKSHYKFFSDSLRDSYNSSTALSKSASGGAAPPSRA